MRIELDGLNCLVTGASTGIGAGVARALAAAGARLAITARRQDLLERLAREIAGTGKSEPRIIAHDITLADGPARIARLAREELGRIDILVNAAGGSRPLRLDSGEKAWQEAFDLNFHSARRLTEALIPPMIENRWGRVINITGSMEPRGLNGAVAAKAALHMWAKSPRTA
jgi:3-oxoacyl-[acyl-carrier protein] reductase